MEDGLRDLINKVCENLHLDRLNPCFNGRWSARGKFATRRFADL